MLPPIAFEHARRDAFQREWLDVANARREVDVHRLAPGLLVEPAGSIDTRVQALLGRPHDPRIGAAFVAMIQDPPTTAKKFATTWTAICNYLAELRDERQTRALAKHRVSHFAESPTFQGTLQRKVDRLLKKLAAKPIELEAGEATAIEWLDHAIDAVPEGTLKRALSPVLASGERRTKTHAEFLAEIYANPDSDDARIVYADWLQEQNDPRGEFIVLQMRTDPSAEEKARALQMQIRYRRTWLGQAAMIVAKGYEAYTQFRRGFVARVVLDLSKRRDLAEDVVFSTLEWLSCPHADLVVHERMRALRTLYNLSMRAFVALAERPYALAVEHVFVDIGDWERGYEERLVASTAPVFEKLRFFEARIDDPTRLGWLVQSWIPKRAERMRLNFRNDEAPMPPASFGTLLAMFRTSPTLQIIYCVLDWGHMVIASDDGRPCIYLYPDLRETESMVAMLAGGERADWRLRVAQASYNSKRAALERFAQSLESLAYEHAPIYQGDLHDGMPPM